MRTKILLAAIFGTFLLATDTPSFEKEVHSPEPSDYLMLQRAYPYEKVPSEAYYQAGEWVKDKAVDRNNLPWVQVGPANVGGRITDVAMHESDQQTVYAASASGGVWKSENLGVDWYPISDELPSLSIGDIAIAPSDAQVIYCGTGETNGGGGSVTYDGAGIFRSADGGNTWTDAGLANSGSIGRIVVHPEDPNTLWVAAMGQLFENNPERGIYKSIDGGQNWEQQLFVNDSTGAIDLVIHPDNPDTLFAVSWQRVRRPHTRVYGGVGSGIHRSVDGGATWVKLSGGLPIGFNVGRIGIDISQSNPNILYATIADRTGYFTGTYKSFDHGDTWQALPGNPDPGYSSYGWWFGQIRVHPNDPDEVYNLGVGWIKTLNGGTSWSSAAGGLHVDHHALYIHPENASIHIEGNDGGVYVSTNGGSSFDFKPLPITQFYTSEIDFQNPNKFYGGTQDNGTWRTTVQNPAIWEHIFGGDGFVTLVHPMDSNLWYAEYQYGNMGGSNGASSPNSNRSNWNSPYTMDPSDPDIMYFGRERLFKSTNGGLNWTAISTDLSKGNSGSAGVVYGTISTVSVSPVNNQVIWAGTDDGNVWVSLNGGNDWDLVSSSLPQRWVTRIAPHPEDPATAYICLSGFRNGESIAHIYKTENSGLSWSASEGDLPDIPVNDLIIDEYNPATLVIATDVGVFYSTNEGQNWATLGTGLPNVPILDLSYHQPTQKLAAASYGRSMFSNFVPVSSSTKDLTASNRVRVFPNPVVNGTINLSFEKPLTRESGIKVYDLEGRERFKGKVPKGQQRTSLELDLVPGVYLGVIEGMNFKVIIH